MNSVRLRAKTWMRLPYKAEMVQQQPLLDHLGFIGALGAMLLVSDLELGFILVFAGQPCWQNAMIASVVDEIALGISEFVVGAVDQVDLVEVSR